MPRYLRVGPILHQRRWQHDPQPQDPLALTDLRVAEFTYMAMGSAYGRVPTDVSTEAINLLPIHRDRTRRSLDVATALFPMFYRDEKRICIGLHKDEGAALVRKHVGAAFTPR